MGSHIHSYTHWSIYAYTCTHWHTPRYTHTCTHTHLGGHRPCQSSCSEAAVSHGRRFPNQTLGLTDMQPPATASISHLPHKVAQASCFILPTPFQTALGSSSQRKKNSGQTSATLHSPTQPCTEWHNMAQARAALHSSAQHNPT